MISDIKPLSRIDTIKRKKKNPVYGIYAINCKANRKWYILYSNDCERKMREAVVSLRQNKYRNKALQDDFIKYGEKKFKLDIIVSIPPRVRKATTLTLYLILVRKELARVIFLYNALSPGGYNGFIPKGTEGFSETLRDYL